MAAIGIDIGSTAAKAAVVEDGKLVLTLVEPTGFNSVDAANRLAAKLADALEKGTELELFEAAMVLDKQSREELPRLLDALERDLTGRMARQTDRRRLFRAVELTRQVRAAARLNANPGQLAGWLCAGMFI